MPPYKLCLICLHELFDGETSTQCTHEPVNPPVHVFPPRHSRYPQLVHSVDHRAVEKTKKYIQIENCKVILVGHSQSIFLHLTMFPLEAVADANLDLFELVSSLKFFAPILMLPQELHV